MDRSEAGKRGYQKTEHKLRQLGRERTQRALDHYELAPKYCLFCETKIPFEKRWNRFCSSSCAASHNNRGIVRNPRKARYCSCGKPRKKHNKYCDECIARRVYNKIPTFEEAKSDRVRKRVLLEKRGNRCEVCGLSEWQGKPIPIELDHTDGNSDNNSEANLRLICPNCHAQTETYKGANVGKNSSRQQTRRKRYRNGQTY